MEIGPNLQSTIIGIGVAFLALIVVICWKVLQEEIMEFKDVYACYVIRDRQTKYFVGDCQGDRVILREHACRFTKESALNYMESYLTLNYQIEDAR